VKPRRQQFRIEHLQEQELRVHAGRNERRPQRAAILQHHAAGAGSLDDHLSHALAEPDLAAARLERGLHGLGDRPHAAARLAPGAALAVHLAEHVVQQHVGRAGGVRARHVAHQPLEAVDPLECLVLETLVEEIAEALQHQRGELGAILARQVAQMPARPDALQQLRPAAGHVGRALPGNGAHDHRGAIEKRAQFLVGLRIARVARGQLRLDGVLVGQQARYDRRRAGG
jgi:hypothetical protein